MLKSLVGTTLLVASLWVGAQPAELVKEAKQGNAKAQYKLALMLGTGNGAPKNEAEAFKWYRLAAEQGIAEAQYLLGTMLANGRGVPQNEAEAVKWYRLAAEQGYAPAQGNLGLMLLSGNGVAPNLKQAYFWVLLAASKNQKYNKSRDLLAKRLKPTERNEMQAKAAAWKPKVNE